MARSQEFLLRKRRRRNPGSCCALFQRVRETERLRAAVWVEETACRGNMYGTSPGGARRRVRVGKDFARGEVLSRKLSTANSQLPTSNGDHFDAGSGGEARIGGGVIHSFSGRVRLGLRIRLRTNHGDLPDTGRRRKLVRKTEVVGRPRFLTRYVRFNAWSSVGDRWHVASHESCERQSSKGKGGAIKALGQTGAWHLCLA